MNRGRRGPDRRRCGLGSRAWRSCDRLGDWLPCHGRLRVGCVFERLGGARARECESPREEQVELLRVRSRFLGLEGAVVAAASHLVVRAARVIALVVVLVEVVEDGRRIVRVQESRVLLEVRAEPAVGEGGRRRVLEAGDEAGDCGRDEERAVLGEVLREAGGATNGSIGRILKDDGRLACRMVRGKCEFNGALEQEVGRSEFLDVFGVELGDAVGVIVVAHDWGT